MVAKGTRRTDSGYTLVALMIGLTVMSIVIASILPLASAQSQRDKEHELVFRGLQYAEGIRIFRRRYGRYPNTLKEMFEVRPRTIRKLWKDPILNTDKWGTIGLVSGAPGIAIPGPGGAPPGGGTLLPTPTPRPTAPAGRFGSGPASGTPETVGPITGVYSRSKKKAYMVYQGRDTYEEWRFTEQSLATSASGANAPQGGGPGIPR